MQVPQNFMKVCNSGATLTSNLMKSYRKINTTNEKIINERVTFPGNWCCQIRIKVGERPGILVKTGSFLFISQEPSSKKNYIKFVYKEVTVKSLKYFNWCIVVLVCRYHCINMIKS